MSDLAPAPAPAPTGFAFSIGGWAQRIVLIASLLAGIGYAVFGTTLAPVTAVIVKGSGVGLLALAALLLASPQRWWLAAIMAAGALGDVLIALPNGFYAGAGAFAVGHVIALIFYFRQRQDRSPAIEVLAAMAIVGWGLVMPGLVSPPGTPVGALMLYSVLLCGMAAALLRSRFSRVAVLGALLFIASDTLLIMRLGGRVVGDATLHGLLVWCGYYFGQLLIFAGVTAGLTTVPSAVSSRR